MQEYMVKMVSRWLMGLTRLQSMIDCLLKSKFVGYTANLTEYLDVELMYSSITKIPVHCWMLTVIKFLLEGYLDILIHLLTMR